MTLLPFAARTTLRVGGTPAAEIVIDSLASVDDAIRQAVAAQTPWVVLGGGSNVVAADGALDLAVLLMRSHHIDASADDTSVVVTVDAGANWDDLVALSVSEGWAGLEALSGIPGSVGATPIQNVGAYGAQVSDVITHVEVHDLAAGRRRWLAAAECGFGYRTSRFKRAPGEFIVTRVRFELALRADSAPIGYQQLADALGVRLGDSAPLAAVRQSVLAIRRSKGMVVDSADHDTWSTGSYFTNPVVPTSAAAAIPGEAPSWAHSDGHVKLSAAWLIEASGFARGFSLPGSSISVSTKHSLAITNRGGGTSAQVRELEAAIVAAVASSFGVTLEREPVLIGYTS